jgi:hypothetical protein
LYEPDTRDPSRIVIAHHIRLPTTCHWHVVVRPVVYQGEMFGRRGSWLVAFFEERHPPAIAKTKSGNRQGRKSSSRFVVTDAIRRGRQSSRFAVTPATTASIAASFFKTIEYLMPIDEFAASDIDAAQPRRGRHDREKEEKEKKKKKTKNDKNTDDAATAAAGDSAISDGMLIRAPSLTTHPDDGDGDKASCVLSTLDLVLFKQPRSCDDGSDNDDDDDDEEEEEEEDDDDDDGDTAKPANRSWLGSWFSK